MSTNTTVDYRTLLKKYINHVGASEGEQFARSLTIAPCDMLEDNYTSQEKEALRQLFQELRDEDPPILKARQLPYKES